VTANLQGSAPTLVTKYFHYHLALRGNIQSRFAVAARAVELNADAISIKNEAIIEILAHVT